MKLSKCLYRIAATATVTISTVSVFSVSSAMAGRVHAIKNCPVFTNEGRPVGQIAIGLYTLVQPGQFNNGLKSSKIKAASRHPVNIANVCLETNSRGQVLIFPY